MITEGAVTSQPQGGPPPIAGVWRRIGAFLADCLLLRLVGYAIAWLPSPMLLRISPYEGFIRWAIVLAYFGLLNSAVGRGQTVGKWLLGTAVRDADGRPISVGRSLLRTLILISPILLGDLLLQVFREAPSLRFALWIACIGLVAAVVFTMIRNRPTCQGFHDVLCRTYVVRLGSEQILGTPISSRASKALAVPVLFLVYSFLSYQTFGLGALGSGVLPVPLHVSFLWVLPAILVFSVIGGILWNRRGCLINTALGIIVLLLILEITRHCFLTGLHHAQTYGKALASSIQLFHKVHSRWPSSLDELPKDLLPAFDPESISPYLCFKNNDYFDKIGGFFIQYDVEKGSPRLRVGRRKVVFSWNWDESVWERKMY